MVFCFCFHFSSLSQLLWVSSFTPVVHLWWQVGTANWWTSKTGECIVHELRWNTSWSWYIDRVTTPSNPTKANYTPVAREVQPSQIQVMRLCLCNFHHRQSSRTIDQSETQKCPASCYSPWAMPHGSHGSHDTRGYGCKGGIEVSEVRPRVSISKAWCLSQSDARMLESKGMTGWPETEISCCDLNSTLDMPGCNACTKTISATKLLLEWQIKILTGALAFTKPITAQRHRMTHTPIPIRPFWRKTMGNLHWTRALAASKAKLAPMSKPHLRDGMMMDEIHGMDGMGTCEAHHTYLYLWRSLEAIL